MKHKFISILLLATCLAGCETSDPSFLEYWHVYTTLPAGSFEISQSGKTQPFQAYINDNGEIYGTVNGHRFHTSDFFQTVTKRSGFFKWGDYIKDGKNVPISGYGDDGILFQSSDNYGFDWTTNYTVPNVDYDAACTFYSDTQNGWLSAEGNDVDIYKLTASNYTKISSIDLGRDSGKPVSIYFVDDEVGYLGVELYFDNHFNFYKTIDGGETWTLVSDFDLEKDNGNTPYHIASIKAFGDLILGYPAEEGREGYWRHIYISRDGGLTWNFVVNKKVGCYQFLDANTAYSLEFFKYVHSYDEDLASVTYLQKSTDGGITWTRVTNKPLLADNIFFVDENVGIATSYSVLQITIDGGKNWDLLVYPLDDLD